MFEYADSVAEEPTRGLRNVANTKSRNIREEVPKTVLKFHLRTIL
jgi:hypothetical protein